MAAGRNKLATPDQDETLVGETLAEIERYLMMQQDQEVKTTALFVLPDGRGLSLGLWIEFQPVEVDYGEA